MNLDLGEIILMGICLVMFAIFIIGSFAIMLIGLIKMIGG